jgi:hypothetical protein
MTTRPAGHHGEKPSETLVRFIVEKTLGVRVCCYDDRRGTSRPDAIVHRCGGVPLEIVSDPLKSDVQLINALKKIGNRTEFTGLRHGYWVCLTDKARVNNLTWLRDLLLQREDPDRSTHVPPQSASYLFIRIDDKGLRPGEVRFTTGSGGGRPIPDPPDVVKVACAVLGRPQYADVARKLGKYGGVERHAVLVVDDEQDSAFGWLRCAMPQDVGQLPTPQLDPEITHLWITPRYIPGLTLSWSANTGWQGSPWAWGYRDDALTDWEDPSCTEDHTPWH